MQINVGIPRGLLYHEFGEMWSRFFNNMNITTTLSPETNKEILDRGTLLSIDESCLPLKLYIGHAEWLLSRCSHLFVPRIAGYYPGFYLCAKFAGLPDIIRNTFDLPQDVIIAPNIENKTFSNQIKAVYTVSCMLKISKSKTYKAYVKACNSSTNTVDKLANAANSSPKIAIIDIVT